MTTHFYLRPPIQEMAFQLYGRPLHPELFEVLCARRIRRSDYILDLWITTTGHVITWKDGASQLTEIVAGPEELPEWGQLLRHRLRGERCDMVGGTLGVSYQVSFQVETLSPENFCTVHRELVAEGGKGGLVHAGSPNHRWALTPVSSIHVEAWGGGLSLSTFHTFPDECSVVKTQSLIEHE
jgi:uncharacterized protein DUF2617